MATWPGTLPGFDEILADGYRETAPQNVIRTEMETGPAKVRRRGTAAPEMVSGTMLLTTAQVATLRTFFDSTISYGATEFDGTHPRTGASVSMRFMAPPQAAASGIHWLVTLNLEILP